MLEMLKTTRGAHALAFAAAGLATAGLAACGSDDSSGSGATASSTATQSAATPKGPLTLPTGKVTCGATSLGDDPCRLPSAPPSGKKVRIGYFALANNTFAAAMEQGVKDTAAQHGATVTTFLNPFDPAVQQSQIRAALAANKFDAYIVEPINPPALRPLFKQMVTKGLPFATVGVINGTNNSVAKLTFPGQTFQTARPTDTFEADAADTIGEVCRGIDPCRVGIVRGTAVLTFDTSEYKVLLSSLKKYPNVQVAATVFGKYLSGASRTAVQNMLSAHPDVNVVTTFGDQMSVGAEQAIKAGGKAKQIKIISAGGGTTAIAAIKAGRWYASVLTLPQNEGVMGATAVIAAARGTKLSLGVAAIDTRGSLPRVLSQRNKSQWSSFAGQWSGL
jgi:ribose transport system substrate-binding protein